MLAASNSEIASRIYEKELLLDDLEKPKADKQQLEHSLFVWASVIQDRDIRKKLQERRLPFILYQMLRGDSEQEKAIAP